MVLNISIYEFEGPITSVAEIKHAPGVCVIVDNVKEGYNLIDLFSSTDLRTGLENHKNQELWHKNATGLVEYGILYTNYAPWEQKSRHLDIESDIRNQYDLVLKRRKHRAKTPRGRIRDLDLNA